MTHYQTLVQEKPTVITRQICKCRKHSGAWPGNAILVLAAISIGAIPSAAVTMRVAPQSPQPGDVLSVTLVPAPGQKIQSVGMAAFDTAQVKFYARPDGSARAFIGLP